MATLLTSSPSLSSDGELVVRAKQGDHDALTTIYERYAGPIYRAIYYRVGNAELAEDLGAEVFVRMLEGIERYEDRGWPLSAWLYRIAHARSVDALRRQRSRPQIPLNAWLPVWEDGPENEVVHQIECEQLHDTITRLTPDQRAVIEMRFLQEMSVSEVAIAIGRTEGAVKALQHRGVNALQRQLVESN